MSDSAKSAFARFQAAMQHVARVPKVAVDARLKRERAARQRARKARSNRPA